MKRLKSFSFLALLLAALTMTGCWKGTSSGSVDDNKAVTETETVAEQEEETAPEAVEVFNGELGIFELRGPVKSCVWKNQYSTRRLEFDQNGMWTKIDGRKPWADQPNVKRDSQGRMVKTDNGDESTQYTYDDQGRITQCIVQYMDGCDNTKWTYDDNGDCVKNVNSYVGMDAEEGDDNRVSTYTILERDDHGNWTSRKDQNGNKETRTITYY